MNQPPQHATRAIKTRSTETRTHRKGYYEPITASFKHDGFAYRQIWREGAVAIYEQRWIRCNVAYEVIKVQRHEAHTFPSGKAYPEREGYPPSEMWGEAGWTYTDLDLAIEKAKSL